MSDTTVTELLDGAQERMPEPKTVEDLFAGAAKSKLFPDTFPFGEIGDTIVGKLVRYEQTRDERNIAVLQPENGPEWSVWLTGVALRDEWEEVAPQIGETVGVRLLDIRTSAAQRQYKVYAVVVLERPNGEPAAGTVPWLAGDPITEPGTVEPF